MHSPIIYIIENDSDFAISMKGVLPQEKHMLEEDLLDYITESDWLKANTLEDKYWHRNQWNEEFELFFNNNPYVNLIQNKDNGLFLSFNKTHINKWYKRIIELNNECNTNLEQYICTNNKETEYNFPFNSISHYIEYKDLMGLSFGGPRYVLYTSYKNELEMYDVLNLKQMIEYVRNKLEQNKLSTVSFQLCQNIVGDYHY
ncbi:hypothetical protein U271_01861 [Staphylococcus aureus F70893]|uniref:hypothetical protein n=1 Tax=Staphylococcus TaxID=1279 RepID=UPI0004499E71|nr:MULTISPECIES: hypothetical protein [Staphylococcus]EVX44299.1 hypothetical protein U271_01861 [Staphylococcus aureus F70893]EVX62703.1 hypothetical protein U280_02509 [Staphylococcus aureus F77047]EWW99075.1 hypothetical protein V308_01996 [Staphylococcus aureus H81433]MBG1130555.1 hypothetical protein [Staphylococcus aureus]MDI1957406.1 hypothetical protein [Staphylococcus aureus]